MSDEVEYLERDEDYRTANTEVIYWDNLGNLYVHKNTRIEKVDEDEVDLKSVDELLEGLNKI